ncbi:MAG: hemerythrin domain-containing protein [bacterium]|nr:hemerythrin domain-containing protein [bacterium]
MANLIEELKKEHVLITETFKKINKLGISSKESRALMLSAKARLLVHMEKEDEQLYPVLQKEAEKSSSLKRILDTFTKNMEEISQTILVFFDSCLNREASMEFAQDFGQVFAVISHRIRREETILYRKYEEIQQEAFDQTMVAKNALNRVVLSYQG